MNQSLDLAKQILLYDAGLTENKLQIVLDKILSYSVDAADIYFQTMQEESWTLEDGLVKEGSFDVRRGVGVRAISGEKTGFAYSDEIDLSSLEQAAKAARSVAYQAQNIHVKTHNVINSGHLYPVADPLDSLADADKVALLQRIDREARHLDSRVQQVLASLSSTYEIVLIINSDGEMIADTRPLVHLNITVIAEENGRWEQGVAGGGCRKDYHYFLENNRALVYVKDAVRQALVNLEAKPAPAGTLPVVLGPGWPAVLLHEAVGHGLEGDFNRKGSSVFSGRMGERVATNACTVVDDGTLPNRRGSLNVDDEGIQTQCTVLIERGILKGYMQDKLNAKLMNMPPTGNGRRESYAHMPLPRMTNTYMLPGDYEPGEIISTVDKGIYAVNFAGGQVDITSGKFVFSTSEAYLIEKGKVTFPIKGATLIGNGPDVLTKVSMVGNDFKLDEGIGVCGKDGQSIPVGVGQSTLKVDQLTVGGTT